MASSTHPLAMGAQAAGASAKGTVILPATKVLRSLLDGAPDVQVPAALSHYIEYRVLASRWYPEEDYLGLLVLLAGLLEKNRATFDEWTDAIDVWQLIGRWSVKSCFEGEYRALFRQQNVVATLKNFGAFWSLLHDTGVASVRYGDDGRTATLDLERYAVVDGHHCRVIQGLIWGFLVHGGASPHRVALRKTLCTADGAERCSWELAW